MPLSAAEESELGQLSAELGIDLPPAAPQTGVAGQFFRPLIRGVTEAPRKLLRLPIRAIGTFAEDMGFQEPGFAKDMLEAHNERFDDPTLLTKVQPPEATQTTGQSAARIAGELGGSVAQMLLLRRGVPALGAGAIPQNVASDAFAGAVMDEDRPERGAAEFGALSLITGAIPGRGLGKALLRTGAQAAVPVGTDAVNDELGPDTLNRAAVFGASGAAGEALPWLGSKWMLRKTGPQHTEPAGPPVPPPEPIYMADTGTVTGYRKYGYQAPEGTPEVAPTTVEGHDEALFGQIRGAAAPVHPRPSHALPAGEEGLSYQPPRATAEYQGIANGQHNFKDLRTGSNFVVTGEPTPEAITSAQARVHQRYEGDVQATPADIDRILNEQRAVAANVVPAEARIDIGDGRKYTPAMQMADGSIVTGPSHPAIITKQLEAGITEKGKRGFLADDGTFEDSLLKIVRREETKGGFRKLGRKSEEGALPLPLVSGVAGAAVGYASGDDTESRLRNAAIGAAIGAGIPKGASLLRRAGSLRAQAEDTRTPSGLKVATKLGKYVGSGRSVEDIRASEKQKGFSELMESPISRAAKAVTADERNLTASTPAAVSALDTFFTGSGAGISPAALKAAGISAKTIELATRAKESKVAYQREIVNSLGDTPPPPGGVSAADWEKLAPAQKRAIVTNETLGTYQARTYGIDVAPKDWTKDDAAYRGTLAWLKERNPTASDDLLRSQLDTYLTARYHGEATPVFGGGQNKIGESLYIHRKDLSDREWQMLGALSANPDVPPSIQAVLSKGAASKTLTSLEQQQVGLLARNHNLTDADRAFARKVAERTILPPAFRKLLGEVVDPLQRELLTVAKLSKSAGAARYINEISGYTRENGLKAAMTTAEYEAAKAAGKDVSEYVQLNPRSDRSDAPSLGRLADKWVTPDVARRLTEVAAPRGAKDVAMDWLLHKPTSVAKQAVTVFNPATHGRQIMQAPLMMIAGRVNPRVLGKTVGLMRDMVKNPDHPMLKQMVEDHILNANFSKQEIAKQGADYLKKNGLLRRAGNIALKPVQFARKLYGAPDDVVRMATYLSALERFKGDRSKAIDFTNRFTPNYGQVPEIVAGVRKLPVGAPFLSWTSEMMRITKNLAQEFLEGKTYRDRVWAAAGLSALAGGGLALGAASKALLSKSERDEFEKSEKLMKSYQRNQSKLVLGKNKAGGRDFVGLQSVTPAGDLVSFAQSIMRGDWESVFSENPLFGLHKNPIASAAIDVVQGEHHFTGDKLDTPGEKARRVAEAFVPPASPLSLASVATAGAVPPAGIGFEDRKLKRLYAAGGDFADTRTGQVDDYGRARIRNLGFNRQSAKYQTLLRNAKAEEQRQLSEAQRDYRRDVSGGTPAKIARDQLLLRRNKIEGYYRQLLR